MDGLLVINKPKDITSRDVVNKACKILETKKIGHTGTLDPLATGVLVLCVNRATKLVDMITSEKKEYIAEATLGIKTDTGDITGNVISSNDLKVTKKEVELVLKNMIGNYEQTVPIYSAVKVNGKKLYEYARANEEVELPKRTVIIEKLELLSFDESKFTIKTIVSKGTYIRSLIEDIAEKLNTLATMSELKRVRQGDFTIEEAIEVDEIDESKLIPITKALNHIDSVVVKGDLVSKIKNGQILDNICDREEILFKDEDNQPLAIYKKYDKDAKKIKPSKMF
jgi:tRNA pseudouridine55 synthase